MSIKAVKIEPNQVSHRELFSLRDYFAGCALQGYLTGELDKYSFKNIPTFCYELADLMIDVRKSK